MSSVGSTLYDLLCSYYCCTTYDSRLPLQNNLSRRRKEKRQRKRPDYFLLPVCISCNLWEISVLVDLFLLAVFLYCLYCIASPDSAENWLGWAGLELCVSITCVGSFSGVDSHLLSYYITYASSQIWSIAHRMAQGLNLSVIQKYTCEQDIFTWMLACVRFPYPGLYINTISLLRARHQFWNYQQTNDSRDIVASNSYILT
jgi:hypothetical protein